MALPERGTFKVQTLGKVETKTSKDGNPYRTADLQFEGDAQWYTAYWPMKEDPAVGMELTGEKQYHEKFGYQFNIDRPRSGGGKGFSPAAAYANSYQTAAIIVQGYLGLSEENLSEWKGKCPKGKGLLEHYLTTVSTVAKFVKDDVGKLAGEGQKVAESDSTPPPSSPSTPPPAGSVDSESDEEEVDLGDL